jgi:hypothetical protein
VFPIHGWNADRGDLYIEDWIEDAARHAGR